jgi:hypothetical protein
VLEDVGHCLWTFTMPKMLRGVFATTASCSVGCAAPPGRWCAT